MIRLLFAVLLVFHFFILPSFGQDKLLVLKGATVIDVDNFGNDSNDIKNSVVILQHGQILAVGPAGKVKIPAGAEIKDVSGKFIVPGLIDGFGSVTNQAFANAYLYMGVTSVVTVEDDRRGKTFYGASPGPTLYKQDAYWGADRVPATGGPAKFMNINYRDSQAIRREIDSLAKAGARVLIVHYGVKPGQLATILAACKEHGIATVGELGFTSYHEAVQAGVQSLVHTSRYTADVLPDSVRSLYSNAPFGPPASFYYEFIARPGILTNAKLLALASLYSTHHIGLLPTGSLLAYPFMPFARNPWKEPAAALIDEKDITHEPLDKQTGKPLNISPSRSKAAPLLFAMDSLFIKAGAHYLSGSGATAFGTLPGISLHTELEYFSHAGLTNRQVIAAATNNYSLLWNWRHIGKIEAGREASLLLLAGNPLLSLDSLKSIDVLILKGKQISRQQLIVKP